MSESLIQWQLRTKTREAFICGCATGAAVTYIIIWLLAFLALG